MSSECDALRAQLSRIEAQIAGLDSRFIPKAEKPSIVAEAVENFKSIHPALFGGLFLGAIQPFAAQLTDTALAADLAKQIGRAADGKAVASLAESNFAKRAAEVASTRANAARALASTAQNTATGAKNLANTANGVAQGARGLAQTATQTATTAASKATTAATKAANAIGISNSALSKAGTALSKALSALGFIANIFAVLQTVAFAYQIAQLTARVTGFEALLNRFYDTLLRLIGINSNRVARAQAKADKAERDASAASVQAVAAASTANRAQESANSALSTALQAIALVTTLLYLPAAVRQVRGIAVGARTLAQQALQRARIPGPRGLRGLTGLQGPRGLPGRNGAPGLQGRPGRQGAPGLQGRTGQQGRQGVQGLQGRPGADGRQGLQGLRGLPGEDNVLTAADRALLQKIDRQTASTNTIVTPAAAVWTKTLATVEKSGNLTRRVWQKLQVDRYLQYANYALNLHNAFYLSKNIAESASFMLDTVLQVVGWAPTDADNNPISLGTIASQAIGSVFNSVVGATNAEALKATLQSYSRTYQAATNVLYTVGSIVDSSRAISEITGEHVGKIGNALKSAGAVQENAYGWMPEKMDAAHRVTGRWEKMFTKLETTENVVGDVSSIASEVQSIQQTTQELTTEREELRAAMKDIGLGDTPPSEPITQAEDFKKVDSEAPENLESATVGAREG